MKQTEGPYCPTCKKLFDYCDCSFQEEPEEIETIDSMDIAVELTKCTVQLDKATGEQIKDLISEHYHYGFPSYCTKVGISPPNFYNVVNGDRACSLDFLNKLLSGIQYEAIISNPEIRIQELPTGEIVNDADSIIHERE